MSSRRTGRGCIWSSNVDCGSGSNRRRCGAIVINSSSSTNSKASWDIFGRPWTASGVASIDSSAIKKLPKFFLGITCLCVLVDIPLIRS